MSEVESRFVKRGYWVNLSKGPIMGQTITTDTQTGAFLVALLAITTSLGMSHLWHLITFFYHQSRADGRPSDGLFRHQQALFRTLPTPSSLTADSIKLWYAWRGVGDHTLARSLPHTIAALLFAVGSIAVSVFSSSVASSTDLEVLVNSPFCGIMDPNSTSWQSYLNVVSSEGTSYASSCYRAGSLPSRCDVFSHSSVPFTTESSACPFDQKMCASPAVSFDSGLVDVNDAFGLNLHASDRVRYHKVASGNVLGRPPLPDEEFVKYLYGNTDALDFTVSQSLLNANANMQIRTSAVWTYVFTDENDFVPIPDLKRHDADVTLRFILKNSIMFMQPVDDPMYSAHREVKLLDTQGENNTRFISDFPGSHQMCVNTPNGESCTALSGLLYDYSNETIPGANQLQLAVLRIVEQAALIFDNSVPQSYIVEDTSDSRESITEIPDDQWIKETQRWEAIVWATHQIMVTDVAIGPAVRDPLSQQFVLPPTNEQHQNLCRMQKMRKQGGFVNFNYFGLVFTISVSGTIVLIDLVLLRFLIYLRKFQQALAPRIDRWTQDSVFQLDRRAHEAQGNGIWKDLDNEVPVTTEGIELPDLLLETLPPPSTLRPLTSTQLVQSGERTSFQTLLSETQTQGLGLSDLEPRCHGPGPHILRDSDGCTP
ncbi:hypothetical protein BDV95DRAFT_594151 [Massariosphaeria phaeospora]|uniref:Uncharacterized protein n=1 Tax=Massariosphaeria phaeospora TaxID=100035 RepID=A0A7C8I691_9PLEO|nr:hypothetical protein BDV95DRAFT_594151 [Massariosphaeria phaeospora]